MHENPTPTSRSRPPDTTSGSEQRPARRLAAPAMRFDLNAELASLKAEPSWQHADRNARTLVRESALRIVLMALKAGARLDEHRADGEISIQVLAGRLTLAVGDEQIELAPGQLLALTGGVPHDVEAREESAFLLTIAG